jgi:hypothetical protein
MSTTKNGARRARKMTDDEIRAALSDGGPVGVRRERLTAVKRELEARQTAGAAADRPCTDIFSNFLFRHATDGVPARSCSARQQ